MLNQCEISVEHYSQGCLWSSSQFCLLLLPLPSLYTTIPVFTFTPLSSLYTTNLCLRFLPLISLHTRIPVLTRSSLCYICIHNYQLYLCLLNFPICSFPRSHTNHNHVHDSLSKRAFREEDGVPVELTDSDGLEDRRTLDLSLGLAASTGTAGSMQTWAGQRSLTPGGLFPVECCPSEVHLIHPRGGISRDGRLLELYRDHRTVQTFYQSTCLSQVRDRPCHFVRQSLQRFSRCVQKYSFVYAFVRDFNVSESFRLDYIRLKSGCSCEVKL